MNLETMGTPQLIVPTVAATAILVAGVVDDFRSKKFHNWLFIVCLCVAVVVSAVFSGSGGLLYGTFGFLAGFALLLPMVLMGIVGAGDMKLMAAFGVVTGWHTVFTVLVFSFIWGALFGVIRTALSGQLVTLTHNLLAIVQFKDRKELQLQKIPFTAAILVGWLSHLAYQGTL
jgi:Flp pilus assembly protein protease CpaA